MRMTTIWILAIFAITCENKIAPTSLDPVDLPATQPTVSEQEEQIGFLALPQQEMASLAARELGQAECKYIAGFVGLQGYLKSDKMLFLEVSEAEGKVSKQSMKGGTLVFGWMPVSLKEKPSEAALAAFVCK